MEIPKQLHSPAVHRAPRGRVGRYALWQFGDYVWQRGVAMALIGIVCFSPQYYRYLKWQSDPSTSWWRDDQVPGLLAGMLIPAMAIGGLISVHGMVSGDRTQGFHRFLFAKPVSISRYYAQTFLAQMLGFLTVVAALLTTFSVLVRPIALVESLLSAALFFTLFGGIGFLLSVLTRYDSLMLLGVIGGTGLMYGIYEHRPDSIGNALLPVLPPIKSFVEIVGSLFDQHGGDVTPSMVFSVIGYGLACFLAGVGLLRRRSVV
ncbi:MAG TPA: hypothetical protein VKA84_27620, partial [Gemmatimonadaceae bacterium]|nr:hypothetical protein [Gemmatimonadaceae bacterium]